MADVIPSAVPPPAFLDFILRHAQVRTNVCSRQKTEHGYTLPRRTVPDYNLIYVTRGRVVWQFEDGDFPLQRGDLLLVPPQVKHSGHSTTRRVTLGSIHVEVTLPGGQDVFDLLILPRIRRVEPGTLLDNYLLGAIREWDRNDDTQTLLMMPSWARLVVLELLRHDARHGLMRQRPIDPLVAAVLDELNQRLDQSTSLAHLAEWSGFSPQHLNRLFRRVLGVTPLQYLTRMRLERGALLLSDDRLSVRAVARKIGFDDPYYFSRLFKRHFGRSPTQYRDATGAHSPDVLRPGPPVVS